MDIKPWSRNLQDIGIELNHIWVECEGHFLAIFRNNDDTVGEQIDDAHIHTALSITLAHCIIGKEESIDRYFKHSDSVVRLLIAISQSVQGGSFDSNEEYHWFYNRLDDIIASLPSVESSTRELASNHYSGADDRNVLYAFLSFHSKLKELSKYTLLRMDVKRVQRKLVNKALTRIDGQLWQSLKSSGKTSIREFFYRSKYRLSCLNNMRGVYRANFRLELGIAFADKAYNPQTYQQQAGILIQDVYALAIDLGDNDTISGQFSLDRELEGFIAKESGVAESSVVIAFKGTDLANGHDWKTDYVQAMTCANDAYLEALGLLLYVRESAGCSRVIRVYGHSLGGGLMQFAVSAAPSGKTYGYGYNSAGLSDGTLRLIPQPMHIDKIRHFRVRNDIVMASGEQLGLISQYDQPVCNFLCAHLCSTLRNVLNVDNHLNII